MYLLCFAICLNFDKFHDAASSIFLPITPQLHIRYRGVFHNVKSGGEHRVHTSYNLRQTNFKNFSGIFEGQVTVFKDYDLFKKLAFFNPLLNTLLAKTHHRVIYDFNFFSHHGLFTLFNTTFHNNILQMTGYDLQLHLRYKNCISNKEKLEIKYCSNTKMFLSYPYVLFVLTLRNYSEPDFPQSKSLI